MFTVIDTMYQEQNLRLISFQNRSFPSVWLYDGKMDGRVFVFKPIREVSCGFNPQIIRRERGQRSGGGLEAAGG